jgi:hypothetical protein
MSSRTLVRRAGRLGRVCIDTPWLEAERYVGIRANLAKVSHHET